MSLQERGFRSDDTVIPDKHNPRASYLDRLQGDSVILIGASEGIARRLSGRFRKVYAADPNRSLVGVPVTKLLKEGIIVYAFEHELPSDTPPLQCDLILFAFCLANLDEPDRFIEPWLKHLRDRGQVVAVEWYGGPFQNLTRRKRSDSELYEQLMRRLEDGGSVRRPSSRDLTKWLRKARLSNVRVSVETAAPLFTEEDLRFLTAEALARLRRLSEGDSQLAQRVHSEAMAPGPILVAHGQYKQVIPIEQRHTRAMVLEETAKGDDENANTRNVRKRELVDLLATALGDDLDDPFETARHVLASVGVTALASLRDLKTLRETTGLPKKYAARLLEILELGRKLFGDVSGDEIEIHSPEDAYRYLKSEMTSLQRETFRGLYLNAKRHLKADEVISIGTLTASLVHPREVFGPAVKYHCHSLLVAHNHPSGDPEPSVEDIHLTRELAEAGRLLGIELLDHIVIGSDGYISLKERGHF